MRVRKIVIGAFLLMITGSIVIVTAQQQHTTSKLKATIWYGTGLPGSYCETACDCAFITECFVSGWPMRIHGYCDTSAHICATNGAYDFSCSASCSADADCGTNNYCAPDGHCTSIQLPTNCPVNSSSAPSSVTTFTASPSSSSLPPTPSSASSIPQSSPASSVTPSSSSVSSAISSSLFLPTAVSIASSVSSSYLSSLASSPSSSSLSFSSSVSSPSSISSSSAKSCTTISDCNDQNICTADQCGPGGCRNDPIVCNDGDACTTDSCDPSTGCKSTYAAKDCIDDDVCTKDSCDSTTGCIHTPVTIPCMSADACSAQKCTAPNTCPDGMEQGNCCTTNSDCDYLDDGFSNCNWGACIGGECQKFTTCDASPKNTCCPAGQQLFKDELKGMTSGNQLGGAFVTYLGEKAFMPVPDKGAPGTISYDDLLLPPGEGTLCLDFAPLIGSDDKRSTVESDTFISMGNPPDSLALMTKYQSGPMDLLSLEGTATLAAEWMFQKSNVWQQLKLQWNDQGRTIFLNGTLLAQDNKPSNVASSPLYLGSFLGKKQFARFALRNLEICGKITSSAASDIFNDASSAAPPPASSSASPPTSSSLSSLVTPAISSLSSSASSDAEQFSCTGRECEEWGGASCETVGRFCIAINEYPCVRCNDDWTSSRSYANIVSRKSFSSSSADAERFGGDCMGTECSLGGDAFCALDGKLCTDIPLFPCVRCEGALATSSLSAASSSRMPLPPFISKYSAHSYRLEYGSSSSACHTKRDCPAGNRCVDGRCLTAYQITLLPSYCGNAREDTGETCDNGAENSDLPNAKCRRNCTPGRCGDGILDTPLELCDDGNQVPGDGCSPSCHLERQAAEPQETLPASVTDLPFSPGAGSIVVVPFVSVSPATSAYVVAPPSPQPPATADTGPAAILVMISGAAAGWAWMRKR